MCEWQECKLGDVVLIDTGFAFKSKYYSEEGNLRVVRGKNVTVGATRWGSNSQFWNHSTIGLEKYFLKEFDIVIGMDGSKIGENRSQIKKSNLPAILAQRVARLRAKENADQIFIWHLIFSDNFENYIKSIYTGTSIPHISQSQIADFEMSLPPLPEQHAIASVLSSLDDKIDLLHRQNTTLEAMAETLFRQWFVEGADEGWEERIITELFEIRDGTHDSPKQKEIGKPLLTSKHILKNRLDIENAYLISEDDFENVNRRSKVDTNDILFSMIGTIGSIHLEQSSEINYAIKNIGLFKTSQNSDWAYYTFLWLKSSFGQDFIHEHRSGSTQEYISLGSLRSIVFICPPTELHRKFNEIVNSYFNKININTLQIRTLEKLRDTLLPKLMSGEVRVKSEQQEVRT